MDDTHLLVRKNTFNVVQCNGCGLVYVNPRMNELKLAELYNVSKTSISEWATVNQRDVEHDKHKIKKFKIAIRLLKKHKKDIKNIFDLGCSTGIFLGLTANEGWVPFGSDVNHKLVSVNKSKFNDNIKLQIGNRIDFPDKYFDVVTLFDSIEHTLNPIAILKEVKRALQDKGLVVISTPNINGLFPKLTYLLLGRTIGAWEHPTPPGHVFQFSPKTLKKILEKAGLEIVTSENFEIYMPYTVGELENSIINLLKNGIHLTSSFKPDALLEKTTKLENNISTNPIKKLPRLLIHGFSWVLVAMVYPLARIFQSGDSMIVIAKKKVSFKTRNTQNVS